MINFDGCQLSILSIHQLTHAETSHLHLSDQPVSNINESTEENLLSYFLSSSKDQLAFERFTFSNGDPSLNPLFILCQEVFDDNTQFHSISKSIAQHLYQCSQHPNIKSGELCVALLDNIMVEDELIQAIGLFKSETKDEFLKIAKMNQSYDVQSDMGIAINKLDKGCIIYNYNREDGFVLSLTDKSNPNNNAQYWKTNFINSTPRNDAFQYTKSYMNLAQTYISHQLTEEFEVSKPDQIDLLNKSSDYFKSKDHFSQKEFKEEVLGSQAVIDSFEAYSKEYQEEMNISIAPEFGISKQAVKKSAKDFKSVLKLDKNFHVYIHGDRKLIERGVDPDGRQFYKLYFEQET